MQLKELVSAFASFDDYTRLGHLVKDCGNFVPLNDSEFNAKSLWCEFLKTFFDNKFSAYITSDTIKDILDSHHEIYNPAKIDKVASFLRNKLKPAQPITDEWLIYFVRRFR